MFADSRQTQGRLKCLGEQARLKDKLSAGYRLTIGLAESKHAEGIVQFVKSLCPSSYVTSRDQNRVVLSLPKKDVVMSKLFSELEGKRSSIGIKEWELTQTTLEEVFLSAVQEQ